MNFYFSKLLFLALSSMLWLNSASALYLPFYYDGNKTFDEINGQLRAGNKDAFKQLAPYLDSTVKVREFLGFHNLQTPENEIALRILQENCAFTKSELIIDINLTSARFSRFLEDNFEKIQYSRLADAYFITPFDKRTVSYVFTAISPEQKHECDSALNAELKDDISLQKRYRSHDPEILLYVGSRLFAERNRFNDYSWNEKKYADILRSLTNAQVGVPDKDGNTIFWDKDGYYSEAKLNFLIYWAIHYKDYQWNKTTNGFISTHEKPNSPDSVNVWLQMMFSKNDEAAHRSYTSLCEADPGKVLKALKPYKNTFLELNNSLSGFSLRFLEQMAPFTYWCRQHGISYKPGRTLSTMLDSLEAAHSLKTSLTMESRILSRLNAADLTGIEYHTIVNGSRYSDSYYTGRLLDKAYGKLWSHIASDTNQLKLYLTKAYYYKKLGIIGYCNYYCTKLIHADTALRKKLMSIKNYADVPEMRIVIDSLSMLWHMYDQKLDTAAPVEHVADAPADLEKQIYDTVKKYGNGTVKAQVSLEKLLGTITYKQIGTAVRALEKIDYYNKWAKYDFVKFDFGLQFYLQDSSLREKFLTQYDKLTQYGMYKLYLDTMGIDYKTPGGDLDYKKIYSILKCGCYTGFIGGAGGTRCDGVYAIIKLLEIKTNQHFFWGDKLDYSGGASYKTPRFMTVPWMYYLTETTRLVPEDTDPPSFGFGLY